MAKYLGLNLGTVSIGLRDGASGRITMTARKQPAHTVQRGTAASGGLISDGLDEGLQRMSVRVIRVLEFVEIYLR